jgi:hypothetical protein
VEDEMQAQRVFAVALIGLSANGCAILGPTCLARQKTGTVTTVSGRVEAGQVIAHVVPYELKGSENDVRVTWDGQSKNDGPRLTIYATSAACERFTPPPSDNRRIDRGDCTVIGSAGGFAVGGAIVLNSILITGPGNGAPADFTEYKLHVVGDARQAVSYSITVTWFSGPDC